MAKEFNLTGLCIPEKHYMVDMSDRITQIIELVDRGKYFTINRPRQYGKTTTLYLLSKELGKKYLVIDTSFEAASDKMFESEENFCGMILDKFAGDVRFTNKELATLLRKHQEGIDSFKNLSDAISDLVCEAGRDIVLLIDEVDKDSNNRIFLKFLGLLRNKYLARDAGKDITFQSVILAGVHDIKNLKLAIRDENESRFNSPWNIAMKFEVNMSFTAEDIDKMLVEYKKDNALDFDTIRIAEELFKLTNGYPYLVSDLCLIIDTNLNKNWTPEGVVLATKQILNEKSTLFDDVIKNIENNPELKGVVRKILFEGVKFSFSPDAYEKGIIYGIFAQKDGRLAIHNPLFEQRLYNFLLEQSYMYDYAQPVLSVEQSQFIENGKLDMEKVLRKFKEFMFHEYRKNDEKFYESYGRLLFLAFIKPIINAKGHYFVEPETRENKRMDVVVLFGGERFIVELKIWYGEEYENKGIKQLADYLDKENADTGWLITFGLNKTEPRDPVWMEFENKRIFRVLI